MDTKKRYFLFFKENVCSGYSLEATLSNVNDSFTVCDPVRDEYPQLTSFREIYRKRSNNL